MRDSVADYVHSLGLDAYVVGGAVRDELLGIPVKDLDFVVPGVGHAELRAALEPHGKVEDLIVGDQRVGVRLLPRDKAARALQPGGIEFAPPRVERSTGPGRHDFEIVADAGISLEQDMERRDFTINAIARRLETGEVLDPLGGRADLERRVLRTTSPTSFRDDPLRIVRGLRFVSQLDVDPDEDTLRQMREWAPQIEHVSGERIGGGLAADGMGELSKLLLGAKPAKALRLARDAGVLVHLLPELEPAIGFDQESRYHDLPLDEHTFEVVQAAADAGAPLRVRLAALLHDLGKPESAWRGSDGRLHFYAKPKLGKRGHEEIGAEIASRLLNRLRYPAKLRQRVRAIVLEHMFGVTAPEDTVKARKFLHRHGDELAFDLVAHKRADLQGKRENPNDTTREELERLDRFNETLVRELDSPHRLDQLVVDGNDLIELGWEPGPALGAGLGHLLACVIGDPSLNEREWLLAEAERQRDMIRWRPPGPYEVAFSTREGGVSEGPYASLNLGRMSGDDVDRVDENRRRLCAEIGGDPLRLALNRQVHSTVVHRAEPGARGKPGDGLWTEEPDVPVLALTADCVPIALARVGGDRPGVAVLHVGWRGLLAGIVAQGAEALGGRLHAAVGPAIGPCCYEVGADVSEPFAAAYGPDVLRGRNLDLWSAADRALREAGVEEVERVDLCTHCNPELFFSHRRTGLPRGGQGVIARVA